jgi:hypothetical protein
MNPGSPVDAGDDKLPVIPAKAGIHLPVIPGPYRESMPFHPLTLVPIDQTATNIRAYSGTPAPNHPPQQQPDRVGQQV